VFIRISTSEPCLEARFRTIKPRFLHFWVDSNELGLGFEERKRERPVRREEEREMSQRNE